MSKKSDGSQVKESTDSSTTIDDDDSKGKKYGAKWHTHSYTDLECKKFPQEKRREVLIAVLP